MGIQINGQTDTISAADGGLNVSGADLGSASAGSLNVTGIVTATSFVGNLTGNINATGVSTIATLNVTQSNLTNLNVSGVSTFSNNVIVGSASSLTIGRSFIGNNVIGLGQTTTPGRNSGVGTATGALIYNSTLRGLEVYTGTGWFPVSFGGYLNDGNPFGDGSNISYYKFEGNGNDFNGVNNSTGASLGTPTFTNTPRSQYWNNPSTSTYSVPTIVNAYPFSIAAWIQIPSATGWSGGDANRVLVNTSIAGQRVTICLVDWDSNNVDEWSIMYGGTNHWTFAPRSRPTDTWIHIVYSIVGSNNSSHAVYQNGVSCTATNRAQAHGGTAGWRLGGNVDNAENFSGYIYNLRVFNRALSQSESISLYNNDLVQ